MKSMRWILPGLALAALLGNGCILLSGQIEAHFDLASPITINPPATPFYIEHVDLNTIKEYSDNVDKLKGLSDIAIVGKFKNLTGPAGSMEIWIAPGTPPDPANLIALKAGATLLWGPGSIGAAPAEHDVNWNESSKLFSTVGKAVLIDQLKHGGKFTVYILSNGQAGNTFEVDQGAIIIVIAAGA